MSYVEVSGLRTWHLVTGEGDPVVLLHGAFSDASSFDGQIPAIAAAGYRVHVPERRGHGHTPDVDGALTYEVMAQDTIAYLEQEVRGRAHLVGWSDGAVVALLVARDRPDLVGRMVLIGQYYNSSGKITGGMLSQLMEDEELAMRLLRPAYDRVSPDGPDHFPTVFAKTMRMIRTEPELDLAGLGGVTAPTLLMQGDWDEVLIEHSIAMVVALAEARLAVLPGTHMLPIESPDLVNTLVLDWLRDSLGQSAAG
ncbi:MAG: alpha/beta hydrolase [Actinocatenispora sp.]